MKKTFAMILALALALSALVCGAAAAEGMSGEEPAGTAPTFMKPAYFAARFNTMMEAMADKYAEQLGEDGVRIIKEQFTFVTQEQEGSALVYQNSAGDVKATFIFGDEASVNDKEAAPVMNLVILSEVPEIAAYFARYGFQMMIGYDFQEEVNLDDLVEWFRTAEDPDNIFRIPGYTLNVIKNDALTLYAVLPPADQIPQLNETP